MSEFATATHLLLWYSSCLARRLTGWDGKSLKKLEGVRDLISSGQDFRPQNRATCLEEG